MGLFCTPWFPGHYLPSGAAIKWTKNIGSRYNRLDRFHNTRLHGTARMVNSKRGTWLGKNVRNPYCVYRGPGRYFERKYRLGFDWQIWRTWRYIDPDQCGQLGSFLSSLATRIEIIPCQFNDVLCNVIRL